jgi:glycosyltransferase involved in cell wall biosynthesis
MRITYLTTHNIEIDARQDAVAQDIERLKNHFEGSSISILPALHTPPQFFGWSQLPRLRKISEYTDVFHVTYANLVPMYFLQRLNRPVVFVPVGGVSDSISQKNASKCKWYSKIVVSNDMEAQYLKTQGLENVKAIRPCMNLARWKKLPQAPSGEQSHFHVLFASAPWSKEQFISKGVDALLYAASQIPDLRVTFLWRGKLYSELMQMVNKYQVENQVVVFDDYVDLTKIMPNLHAAILTTAMPGLVKDYPHSLLEALLSGRPVITSRHVALAKDVAQSGAGIVTNDATSTSVLDALTKLKKEYAQHFACCQNFARNPFSMNTWLKAYKETYTEAVTKSPINFR